MDSKKDRLSRRSKDWPFARFSVILGERSAIDRSLRPGCLVCKYRVDVFYIRVNADRCRIITREQPISVVTKVIVARTRMRNMRARIVLLGVLLICTSIRYAESRSKKTTQLSLQSKETNVVNFMRLLVMRLVFGVASAMGLGENLSGVLGGIFVPPGADDYNDYNDYGDDVGFVPDFF
ncbi:uncharacterized protein LOC126855460 [Cataglyphis hispanica]|uniref:uncharacterized protein LOC126855460 n=1 Tax=Cataglyphis hispanica TaxID=1086592 RepID=UPI00217F5B1C|nr:uncharacterized protein LOC126855460 [Cataglyphis hispanica]